MGWVPGGGSDPEARKGRPRPPLIAPAISLVGLVAVTVLSLYVISLFGFFSASRPEATDDPNATFDPNATAVPIGPGGRPTPNPSVVITPPPEKRPTIAGTILFTRTGNIWAASGLELKQVTNKGIDSQPAWGADGKAIYFIQTGERGTDAPNDGYDCGHLARYTLYVTTVAKVSADGSGRNVIYDSIFKKCGGSWFTTMAQPDVSPDGKTLVLVSDGTDGLGDVVLATMTTKGNQLQQLNVREVNGLGHNDPAWSPDGTKIAFTYNGREGGVGAPKIAIYNVATHQVNLLRKGYAKPSWSPDGKYLAAERTTPNGRDVVIVDPGSGVEIVRLTTDGDSFAPVFSPNGDQIAYLHRLGLGVDLHIMTLSLTPSITLVNDKPVTEDGSLDAVSPPAWFIPSDQRTKPGTSPSGPPSSSAEPSASAAP